MKQKKIKNRNYKITGNWSENCKSSSKSAIIWRHATNFTKLRKNGVKTVKFQTKMVQKFVKLYIIHRSKSTRLLNNGAKFVK